MCLKKRRSGKEKRFLKVKNFEVPFPVAYGFTQIPNDLLIALARAQICGMITSRERAVIDFIIRYAYGYQKNIAVLKTSFIAKELGTTADNISHILKRLENKNIILRNFEDILINCHYEEWKNLKLPNRFNIKNKSSCKNSKESANIGIDNSINKELKIASMSIDNIINMNDKQNQLKANSDSFLNKNINKNNNIYFNGKTFKFENIPREKIDKWCKAFPIIDVEQELKKMEAWLSANPKRRKKNYEKFIVNWLLRAKGGKSEKYVPISRKRAYQGLTAGAGEW